RRPHPLPGLASAVLSDRTKVSFTGRNARSQNVSRPTDAYRGEGGHASVDRDLETARCHDARSVRSGCTCGCAADASYSQTPTPRQELLDVKRAYDAGAMSKDEYERLRKKVVEGQ